MGIQERTSVRCSGVNCQHIKIYNFNTVWESLIRFQQGISQTQAMLKIGASAIMQEATPNIRNLSSNLAPLKCDFVLIKRICGLIYKFSRSMDLFSTTFCLSSNCLYTILVHIICFDPNFRAVVLASIQMLLAQRSSNMAYFRHYHYYRYLLSIIKMHNKKKPVVMRDQRTWSYTAASDWNADLAEVENHHATIRAICCKEEFRLEASFSSTRHYSNVDLLTMLKCTNKQLTIAFKVLRATVVEVTNVTAIVRIMRLKTVRWPQETGRRPYGTLTVIAATTRLPYGRRKGAVSPPLGRREAAVRFSRHSRQGEKTHAISRPSQGHLTMTLRCGCGLAALRYLKKSLMWS